MLSLEEIKSKTKYQVRGKNGTWYAGSLDYIHSNCPDAAPEEIERMSAESQLLAVQRFWLDHRYATEVLGHTELGSLEDFYKEWSQDPKRFEPAKRSVITTLRTLTCIYGGYSGKTNLVIKNYDGRTMWTHRLRNFAAALEEMDADFDVVEIENKGLDPITKDEILRIVIQSDDLALVGDLAVVSNRIEAEEVFGK